MLIRVDRLNDRYHLLYKSDELFNLYFCHLCHTIFSMNTADAQDILGLNNNTARDESLIPAGGLTVVDRKVGFVIGSV